MKLPFLLLGLVAAAAGTKEDGEFWAFQPLQEPPLPAVENEAWCRNEIDRFVLAKLEEKGIVPNPEADRRRLVRRAYFDLLGLPPPPEEVEAFVASTDPQAYAKLIDRLLANPHYGERWARHWLDIARFAESHGFEHDYNRPYAYHFRDFVIQALNRDLPYDQFVMWQLAGDEMAPGEPLAMMATGFLGAGVFPTQITANEVERTRYDALDDMLATTGTAMLGLTVGCARCHDHKFDPISTTDYYRLLSTFTTTVRSEVEIDLDPDGYRKAKAKFDLEQASLAAALKAYEDGELADQFEEWLESKPALPFPKELAELKAGSLSDETRARLFAFFKTNDEEWIRLICQTDEHRRTEPKPKLTKVQICSEGANIKPMRHNTQGADFFEQTFFLNRGDTDQKAGVATQSFLQVLMRAPEKEKRWQIEPPKDSTTSFRRSSLANWITDTEHGAGHLLARVIVNRLWQHHFGRGIVATPNDFGSQGERPANRELLDWLSRRMIAAGWSIKSMHRLMMTSAAYMQNSQPNAVSEKIDPLNEYSGRRVPRRLEAEAIRDAMLSVSGLLDERMFGPGMLDPNQKRRSIYFTVKRSQLIPMMQLFDAPEPLVSVGSRPQTIIAPQALFFLNNPQVREFSLGFAARVLAGSPDFAEAVERGFRIALARPPSPAELRDSIEFIERQTASYREDRGETAIELAFADFCQSLLSLNEFIYIE